MRAVPLFRREDVVFDADSVSNFKSVTLFWSFRRRRSCVVSMLEVSLDVLYLYTEKPDLFGQSVDSPLFFHSIW